MRRLHCAFSFFFFFIQSWNKNSFFWIFQRERVWSSKKPAQSGVWDPVLDSCCESCGGYYLASLILQGFWSFFWVLGSNFTLRIFTLEPETHLQKNLSLINFSINRSNYRRTYLTLQAVLWNPGPMNLAFPFRLATWAPSNARNSPYPCLQRQSLFSLSF